MGLSEKVVLGFLILVFVQISSRYCMPRSINIMPLQTNKKLKKNYMCRPNTGNPLANNCPTYNIIKQDTNKLNDKPNKSQNKYSKNLLNKLIKKTKAKYAESCKTEQVSSSTLAKPFTPSSQPFCFKEIGTFPEVEYPMFVTDTWSPNYWKKLPNLQQKKKQEAVDRESTYKPNYNKQSDKTIEKAMKALNKLRERSNKESKSVKQDSTKSTSTDMPPIKPSSQCSPVQPLNSTTETSTKGLSSAKVQTNQGTCTRTPSLDASNSCNESTNEITTGSPMSDSDTYQLPYSTSATPEYSDLLIPTATTALPPYVISLQDNPEFTNEITSASSDFASGVISTTDGMATNNDNCEDKTEMERTTLYTDLSMTQFTKPLAPTEFLGSSANSLGSATPKGSCEDTLAPTSSPTDALAPASPINNSAASLAQSKSTKSPADKLPPSTPIGSPTSALSLDITPINLLSNPALVLAPTDTISSPTDTLASSTPINSPAGILEPDPLISNPAGTLIPTDAIISPAEPLTPTDDLLSNRDIDSNDYEFVTMPPNELSYDTTLKNVNADDITSQLSPDDTEYIMM